MLQYHCCPCRASCRFLTILWSRDKEGNPTQRISQALINPAVKSSQVSWESKQSFYCTQLNSKQVHCRSESQLLKISPSCIYRQGDFLQHPTHCEIIPHSCPHPSAHLHLLQLAEHILHSLMSLQFKLSCCPNFRAKQEYYRAPLKVREIK